MQNTNIADVLLDLHLSRRSGILRLSRDEFKKSIYFLDGAIVFAHSNQKSDRLGETLLRLGKISQEDFEIASREVIQKGKRLGQALADLGLISAQEVNSSVHYQLQQIIYSVFDWDSGEYEFVERERPVFEDIMVNVSTPALLMDGIRNINNPVVLQRSYQNNETQVLYVHSGTPRLRSADLGSNEETIVACVDGTKTIAGVRQLAHLSPIEFDRALCSLLLCGMLRLQKEENAIGSSTTIHSDQQRKISQTRQSFTTQPLAKPETGHLRTLSEDQLRRLIKDTVRKFQNATDEEVLNILPGSTLEEIEKAYKDLSSQFQPPYFSQTRFLDLKDPLKSIVDRLTVAYQTLIHKVNSQMSLDDARQRKAAPNHGSEKPVESKTQASANVSATPVPDPADVKQQTPREPISELQDRLRKDPANTILLRRLGKRFYETGKPHEGEKQLLKALELEPQSVENHFALADFYQSMGLKIKAFRHLNIILQLDPNNDRALELLNVKKGRKPLYEIER